MNGRHVAPDGVLEGDDDDPVPFVKVVTEKVAHALRPTTKLDQGIMWDQVDEDIRQHLLASVRDQLEVLPFYTDRVLTTAGEDYDFLQLLMALVDSQRRKKLKHLHSKVFRLARTWLFYAMSVIKWTKPVIVNDKERDSWMSLKLHYDEAKLKEFQNEAEKSLIPGT